MTHIKAHGNLEECVKHFSNDHGFKNADREGCIIRNKVCKLLEIGSTSGYEWFDKGIMPNGVNRLKLLVFLELLGYVVEERAKLTELQKRIGSCLALSSFTAKDMGELVGVNGNAVLRWANGDTEPLPATIKQIEGAIELCKEQMGSTLSCWNESIDKIGLTSPYRRIENKHTQMYASRVSAEVPHDHVLDHVSGLIKELEPLARRLASDEFSPAERRRLRELTALPGHNHSVFELSTHLNRLCGEAARRSLG